MAAAPIVGSGKQVCATPRKEKKAFLKRLDPQVSQRYRRGIQIGFALLNLWIGVEFYLFVRQFEGLSLPFRVSRPAGVEAGCRSWG